MITRGRVQLVRERVQLQNQIESLLEEGRIKLSSVVSDLLGASGKRILRAMAGGETSPKVLAMLGDKSLKCGLPTLMVWRERPIACAIAIFASASWRVQTFTPSPRTAARRDD